LNGLALVVWWSHPESHKDSHKSGTIDLFFWNWNGLGENRIPIQQLHSFPGRAAQYRTLIKKSRFLRVQGKLQKVENAKERGAFVVSINATQLFPLDFPKIETRRRHAH